MIAPTGLAKEYAGGADIWEVLRRVDYTIVSGETDLEVMRKAKALHESRPGQWVRLGGMWREGRVFRQILLRWENSDVKGV